MSSYEPPIFVCGLPRSGSTLLELTISKSPGVLRLAESLYLSPWRRDFRYFLRHSVGDITTDDGLRRLIEIVFSTHEDIPGITGSFWRLRGLRAVGEPELKRRVFEALRTSDRSLGAIFRILLEEITRFNGHRRCCVPFPVHVQYLPTLMEWFPDAKFVHLTRDPRAIAISKTNDPGGTAIYNRRWPYLKHVIRKAMIAFVVVQYVQASRVHARVRHDRNYLLIRYEDMVLRPAETMRAVCEFVGLEFTAEMLEQTPDRAQPSSITGELRMRADATAASTWRGVITPLEETLITMLTRRSMKRFGFDHELHPVYARRAAEGRVASNHSR